MKDVLHIDLETRSPIDIKFGVSKYATGAEIILFGYALNDSPVRVLETIGKGPPDWVRAALVNPGIVKRAFNVTFERTLLRACWGIHSPIEQWEDTMVHAYYCGIPGRLGEVASRLKLEYNKQLDGHQLITIFCKPMNKGQHYISPAMQPEKWARFKTYCGLDVEVEREMERRLSKIPVPQAVLDEWRLDTKIAERGVAVDEQLTDAALRLDRMYRNRLLARAHEVTRLANPNSRDQVIGWLRSKPAIEVDRIDSIHDLAILANLDNLRAKTIVSLLKMEGLTESVREVLNLRRELALTSVKKFSAIANSVYEGRVYELLQFYGAVRTGRWAGRRVQVHNLKRNTLSPEELHEQREILKASPDLFSGLVDEPLTMLAQLIRTVFVPSEGMHLFSVDFKAIEACVLAWVAGETWRLEVFEGDGEIYERSAEKTFGMKPGSVTKKGTPELRQRGKVTELALGYQGGVNALIAMGALDMGVPEEELQGLVDGWRAANPNIVQFWAQIEEDALQVVALHEKVVRPFYTFAWEHGMLSMQLPSGRKLYYPAAKLSTNRFNRVSIAFRGLNKAHVWTWVETYGGKLTENFVQAIARDLLAHAIRQVEEGGYPIVMHVHDELVGETDDPGTLPEIVALASRKPLWAAGCPLSASGFTNPFYCKED